MNQNEFKEFKQEMKEAFLFYTMHYTQIKKANNANDVSLDLVKKQINFYHCLYNLKIEEAKDVLCEMQKVMTEILQHIADNPEYKCHQISKKSKSESKKHFYHEKEKGYLHIANVMKQDYAKYDCAIEYAKDFV